MNVISGKLEKAKKAVLYGPEGIGKSSMAAQFPKPIFIDTEGSTTELEVDRLKRPSSWTELLQQVQWVKTQIGRFQTLVIDTIDWAEGLCINHVCAQHNKKGIEDFGYGNGYVYVKEEFGRFLNLLEEVVESGIHVVLTAHCQIIKFEQPDEMGAYDRYQLKLGKKTSSQTAPLVKEWSDLLLFMNYKTYSVATDDKGRKNKAQGGVRTIYTNHHPAWDAKNRHGLPDEIPMDYNQIAHIFVGSGQAAPNPNQQTTAQPEPAPQPEPQTTMQQEANTAPPVQEPVKEQQPATQSETNTTNPWAGQINPNLPKALQDLMQQNNVSEQEIQTVVGSKGYYPADTPITNYDESFIQGVLVGAWEQVFGMIQQQREANAPF